MFSPINLDLLKSVRVAARQKFLRLSWVAELVLGAVYSPLI